MSTSRDDCETCVFCDEPLTLADNWKHHADFVTCIMNMRAQRDAERATLLERSIFVEGEHAD